MSIASLIVVPKVFRTTARILAWLRTKSLRDIKNQRLLIFAHCEMLSQKYRPFFDTWEALGDHEILCKPYTKPQCTHAK